MATRQPAQTLHLTSANLKTFTARAGPEYVYDDQLKGFAIRTRGKVDPKGWTWAFLYYHRGERKQVQVTLGKFAALTPEQARKAATKYADARRVPGADLWDAGKTDREAREAARAAKKAAMEAEAARPTFQHLWDRYWLAEGQHKKAAHSYKQLWKSHLSPAFASMKVADLTREGVEDFKAERAKTPGACNRAMALLSVMLSRAVTYGWRKGCSPENPVKGTARYPERQVDFHFDAEALGRIIEAAETYADRTKKREKVTRGAPPVSPRSEAPGLAILMLIHTGARAGEVTSAHWGQFADLPDGRLLWVVESTNTKSGKPVTRALNADLSRRLREWMPKSLEIGAARKVVELSAPKWVFPQAANPERPTVRLAQAWSDICAVAGVKGRIHDLRHSVATHMRRRGKSLPDIQQQLGHATIHTTMRYAHHMPEGVIENGDAVGEIMRDALAAARSKSKATVTSLEPRNA
jgi:integrase